MPEEKSHIRGRLQDHSPNPVDVYVGQRMKLRRRILKMSQQTLAQTLGLTFQQIQKYEKGYNRMGASRLWDISCVLGVSMDFFFADMEEKIKEQSPRFLSVDDNELPISFENSKPIDPIQKNESLELLRAYYKIHNRKTAKYLFNTILSIANSTCDDDDEDPNNPPVNDKPDV